MGLTSIMPLPYRILALAALSIALIGFGTVAGLKIGEARLTAHIAKEQAAFIEGMQAAAVLTKQYQKGKDDALNAASARARQAKLDAAAVRAAVDGLRDDLGLDAGKLPGASIGSIRRYTATLQAVFGDCSRRYEALAGTATGHASDALKLEQAWPK